jgi:Fe2+ transport system protein FeoA
VWRSLLSPPWPRAICNECVVQVASAGEPITVLPPTRQQRAAIRKHLADR